MNRSILGVRLATSRGPMMRPRGAVATFCAEHGISRKSLFELRKRAVLDGPAVVLESGPSDRIRPDQGDCILTFS